jgi:hypothetical protein
MGVAVKEEVIKTNCRGCHGGCGVSFTSETALLLRLKVIPTFLPTTVAFAARVLSAH